MGGHLALVEDDLLLGVDARGEISGRDLTDAGFEHSRVLRHGDRVQIDDAIEALMRLLQGDEFGDRAEIIAEMQIAGRLHAGENAGMKFGPWPRRLQVPECDKKRWRVLCSFPPRPGKRAKLRLDDQKFRSRADKSRASYGCCIQCRGSRPTSCHKSVKICRRCSKLRRVYRPRML